jgi:hypothetical protein
VCHASAYINTGCLGQNVEQSLSQFTSCIEIKITGIDSVYEITKIHFKYTGQDGIVKDDHFVKMPHPKTGNISQTYCIKRQILHNIMLRVCS